MLKILQICKKFPYPVSDGETVAIHALANSLAIGGAEVSLLAMNTYRHYFKQTEPNWPAPLKVYHVVRSVRVDNRVTVHGAFLNLFTRASYHISRFYSGAFARALEQWLRDTSFDLIILETLYLAPYIPLIRKCCNAEIVLRAHNVEHEIWDRYASNLKQGPKRWYIRYLTQKLQRYEVDILPSLDKLLAISARDLGRFRKLGFSGPAMVLPVGIDLDAYQVELQPPATVSLGFIGSLDWAPNIEGIQWFLERVWPQLLLEFPALTLEIAGRNTPDWLLGQQIHGVRVLGEVPDAKAFISSHLIQIAPIRSGGGMRVKILESMALGRVVLSTQIGLEGIPAENRQEVLVADSPQEFIDQIHFAGSNFSRLQAIGERARALVASHFDQAALSAQCIDFITQGRQPLKQPNGIWD